MNQLVAFDKFVSNTQTVKLLTNTLVVVDKKGIPAGFVFGRDAFISLLEQIDEDFEKKVKNEKLAFTNPAGKLIDLIEEKLTVNPNLIKELEASQKKKEAWVPFDEVIKSLHV